jgi:hypothetical protein
VKLIALVPMMSSIKPTWPCGLENAVTQTGVPRLILKTGLALRLGPMVSKWTAESGAAFRTFWTGVERTWGHQSKHGSNQPTNRRIAP